MNGKKIIKPFDLEAAKNGAKIETKDGREVEILKWDAENTSYPIEGVILRSKATWANNGKWSIDDPQYCRHDLVIVENEKMDCSKQEQSAEHNSWKENYGNALNTAKMWYEDAATPDYTRVILRRIFPELVESRIRKILHDWISDEPGETFKEGFSRDEILAWLEFKSHDTCWIEGTNAKP